MMVTRQLEYNGIKFWWNFTIHLAPHLSFNLRQSFCVSVLIRFSVQLYLFARDKNRDGERAMDHKIPSELNILLSQPPPTTIISCPSHGSPKYPVSVSFNHRPMKRDWWRVGRHHAYVSIDLLAEWERAAAEDHQATLFHEHRTKYTSVNGSRRYSENDWDL